MKSISRNIVSFLPVFLVATSTSWAQPRDCETDGSIGACVGDLLDVQLETINEVDDMLEDMEAMNMFSFSRERSGLAAQGDDPQADLRARIETLRNQHRRAGEANEATTDDEFDEMIAQGDMEKGKKCQFSDRAFFDSLEGADPPGFTNPNDNFGDGKCNTFMADDDVTGMSVRVNERKENMCERLCAEKMNQKGKGKERFVDGMVDALSTGRGAMQAVAAARASMRNLGSLASDLRSSEGDFQLSQGDDDPCSPETTGPGPDLIAIGALDVLITELDLTITAGNLLTEVLKTIDDVAEPACLQTFAGFNGSSVCIPFKVTFHISSGVTGVIVGVKSVLVDAKNILITAAKIASSFKADAGIACSKTIKGDTEELKVLAGGAADELAAIKALVEETRDLLLTPTGRREGFQD